MANTNTNLHRAKKIRDDEFYTTYETIENELIHYKNQFKDKVVLCNCDNPYKSNFCKYFLYNFLELGLLRFVCTSFNSASTCRQLNLFEPCLSDKNVCGLVLDVTKSDVLKCDISEQFLEMHTRLLDGDGDFRSNECVDYLKLCDIVVTNPPFSLFRELVGLVLKYDKKFLIIGNQNALTYKEIFPLIQKNIVWTGYQFGEMKFRVPDDSEPRNTRYWVDENGQKWRSLGNAMWLTNLDNERRHRTLKLMCYYNPILHPQYDNYDAIHIKNITEIPCDYNGVMAVPITIINKYNSEQFEIVGEANHGSDNQYDIFKPILGGRDMFKRILIRNKLL